MGDDLQIIIAVVLYLLTTIIIGFWVARHVKSEEDYYIGGRKLPPVAIALSERSTDMSAWLLVGMPGLAWELGLSSIWILVGTAGGAVFQWLVYSHKFIEETKKSDAITPNDYIAKKFPEAAESIRVLGAISILIFFISYVGSQFEGAGKILEQTFGINAIFSTILIAFIIIMYSFAGGFVTAVWTDAFQAILMVFTLVILPIVILIKVLIDPSLSIINALGAGSGERLSLFGGKFGIDALILLGVNLSWFFGYMGGEPHIFVRMMALNDTKQVKSCIYTALTWGVLTSAGALLLGLLAYVIYGDLNIFVNDREKVFPFMVKAFTTPLLAGILLAGVLAAVMSTACSQLVMASSAIAEDFYQKVLMKDKAYNEKTKLKISRLATLIIGILSIVLIFIAKEYVYTVVSWGWAGLASVYAPIITLIFFWSRLSKAGVYAAFICGLSITILWVGLGFDEKIITVRLISFPVSFIAAVLFSLIYPKKDYISRQVD
jgi:sodium/proline symporter